MLYNPGIISFHFCRICLRRGNTRFPLRAAVHKLCFYFPLPCDKIPREDVRKMSAKLMGVKEICANRKAFHEYFVLERFEAGIELCGTEVKSIRAGNVQANRSN